MTLDLSEIVVPLLAWYDKNARILPWRENSSPYRVWVSEIMLQQTRVDAAIPYYERFLTELPGIAELASAPEEKLLKLWEGLGYYRRVRNLQLAAKKIMAEHDGKFPSSLPDVLALPGVGDYTAGAILSIAFGRAEPAVDGNVLRVLARLTECPDDIASSKVRKRFADALRIVYPAGRCGDFTQALMELGALICLPGTPRCVDCPLAASCAARKNGTTNLYPVKRSAPERPVEQRTVFLLCAQGKVALIRRPATGLLAGMYEFPNVEQTLDERQATDLLCRWGLDVQTLCAGSASHHVFSHREWEMTSWIADCAIVAPCFEWFAPDELRRTCALPSAFKMYRSLSWIR